MERNHTERRIVLLVGDYQNNHLEETMGEILRFHTHARASAGSRAAREARSSAVTPAFCATSVRKIGSHHSAGIVLRCDHFRAAKTLTPISAASTSGVFHSPTTSLKLETMEALLGHSVLNCKAIVSLDCEKPSGQNVLMAKKVPLTEYERGFIARVRAARASRFDTQEAFCISQNIKQTSYKVFETERLLPHGMIEQYCAAWAVSITWLITGKGAGPVVLPLPEPRRRAKPRPKQRVAVG